MTKMNLVGKKFHRLTVIKEVGRNNRNEVLWECVCECGEITEVTTYRLNKGITKSCGCLMLETSKKQSSEMGKRNKTHGMSKTRIYKTYRGIKDRCLNPNDMHYSDYGGRGIVVCDEWKYDFMSFYNWAMDNSYTDKLTIDRIDVDGNYEPSNCRWVDIKTQANNKRDNRYITYKGETKTLTQWAEQYGLKRVTLSARLDRYGMSFEEAIHLVGGYNKPRKMYKVIDIENDTFIICSRKDVITHANIGVSTIRHYLDKDKLWNEKYKIESYEG